MLLIIEKLIIKFKLFFLNGGVSNINKSFVNINFYSYASFRKRFMKLILDMLENDIGKDKFRKIKNSMYFEHTKGFYVYAPPNKFKSLTQLVKYVCRYVVLWLNLELLIMMVNILHFGIKDMKTIK